MQSRMAIITFTDGDGGNRPDNSLPGGSGRPDNSLPPGAVTLPVFPFDPTIDNSLPTNPPTPPVTPGTPLPTPPVRPVNPIAPGGRFVVKWFACHGLILVPDNSLPPTATPKG